MSQNRRSVLKGAAAAAAGAVGAAAGAAEAVARPLPPGTSETPHVLPVLTAMPTLKQGMSGAAVKELQTRLNALGYWVPITGSFTVLTTHAVYALQAAAGKSMDGVVGVATWTALKNGVRPSIRATSGTLIEIDKPRQLIKFITSGKLTLILHTSTGGGYTYTSSSGATAVATTPTGTFGVYSQYRAGWQEGSLGSLYKPAYWYRGFAIHGSLSIPNYNASHGCARVSCAAMDMLYARNLVPIGRRVVVY